MFLKQSTSQVIKFGPFLDKTDGVTLETGLATNLDNATTGVRISKDGGDFGDRSDATAPTYDEMGMYNITLGTSDTDTCGELYIIFEEAATCLPVWARYYVVEEAIYDALFAASSAAFDSNQRVDVGEWLGTAVATPTTAGVPEVDVTHAAGTAWGSGAITAGSIATDAITAAKIAANAITSSELADGAITAAKIATDAITADKIAAAAITDTEFTATGSGLSVIITDLDDIKGTGFVKDTHSLVDIEAYVDILDDGTSGNAKIATDVAAVLVDTADMQPKLGTPAGASISADIATVDANVDSVLADTGTDGVVIAAAQTVATVTNVTNEVTADMTKISGSAAAANNLEESAKGIISGATTGTPTTTTTDSDLTGYLDDELIGRVIVFTGGTANGQASDITDYAQTNGALTFTALATAPAASDTFVIV